MAYEPKKLSPLHKEILRLLTLGVKPHAIADDLKVDKQTVYNVKNSNIGEIQLDFLEGRRDDSATDVTKRLVGLMDLAVDTFEEALTHKEETPRALRVKVAAEVLDRGGLGKTKNVNINNVTSKLDSDMKQRIKERAMQIRQQLQAQDIDFVEVSKNGATGAKSLPPATSEPIEVPQVEEQAPELSPLEVFIPSLTQKPAAQAEETLYVR